MRISPGWLACRTPRRWPGCVVDQVLVMESCDPWCGRPLGEGIGAEVWQQHRVRVAVRVGSGGLERLHGLVGGHHDVDVRSENWGAITGSSAWVGSARPSARTIRSADGVGRSGSRVHRCSTLVRSWAARASSGPVARRRDRAGGAAQQPPCPPTCRRSPHAAPFVSVRHVGLLQGVPHTASGPRAVPSWPDQDPYP